MKNRKIHLRAVGVCKKNERIYFFNLTVKGVFYLDLCDYSVHFVHKFSCDEDREMSVTLSKSFIFGDKIYFFPGNGESIIRVYDIKNGQEEFIPIPQEEKDFAAMGFFQQNNKVYIVSYKYGFYVLDLQRQQVCRDEEINSLFDSEMLYTNLISTDKDTILIGKRGSNQLFEIDLCKKEIIYCKRLKEDIKIDRLCYDGEKCWILPMGSTNIYELDRTENAIRTYVYDNVNNESEVIQPYWDMVFLEDEILVLNCQMKNIVRINKDKKTIENPIGFPEGFRLNDMRIAGWSICAAHLILENEVLIFTIRGNMLLIYDKAEKRLIGKEMLVELDEVPQLRAVMEKDFLQQDIGVEDEDETVEVFMELLSRQEKKSLGLYKEGIGKRIFLNVND